MEKISEPKILNRVVKNQRILRLGNVTLALRFLIYNGMNEYLTIIALNQNDNRRSVPIIRIHKNLLIPSRIALVIFFILFPFYNVIEREFDKEGSNIYYLIIGVTFGLAAPLMVFKLIEDPTTFIMFIYGFILALLVSKSERFFMQQLNETNSCPWLP